MNRHEMIEKCLKKNGIEADVNAIEKAIDEQLLKGTGIYITLERGFCYAYIEGNVLVIWQMYNEGGSIASHKAVVQRLKEFARAKGLKKLIFNLNGKRLKATMRLYKDVGLKLRMVQMEVNV